MATKTAATFVGLLTFAPFGFAQTVKAPILLPPAPVLTVGAQSATRVPSAVALTITTPSSVIYGQAIDGLAQVTATDGSAVTGTVTFFDGASSFCTLTLADGASCPAGTETGFAAGTYVFTAVYSGDATHAPATSNAVTVTVAQDTTTTTLAFSSNPIPAGSQVVYTAAVAGAHGPTAGTVTFFDGTASIGSAALTGTGNATLSALMLSPGDHAITAVYEGNSNSAASSSAILHETVQSSLAATVTTMTSSANPALTGDSITFTAHVALAAAAAAPPTGTITFVEGGTVLAIANLNPAGDDATFTTSALAQGTHSIIARYSGDVASAPSISAAFTEAVNDAAPSGAFTIAVDQITVAAGETALVPVKITGASSLAKAITLTCSGLPDEASCSSSSAVAANAASSTATLRITTAAPRDCGSSTPYGSSSPSASLPFAAPTLAGLLLAIVPKRRRAIKGLLTALCAVTALTTVTGCGTGNCTDLGTRPGTYTITVTGSAGGQQVSQKVKLIVKP